MSAEVKKISVVVPVYNSAPTLKTLFEEIDKVFNRLNVQYQLVLVDDCSQDNSWDVIKELKSSNGNKITAIAMAKNFSQHNAIFCGMRHCNGDLIITMDDDLQHPPDEIAKLIERQKETGADVVYGISTEYKRSLARNTLSKGFKISNKIVANKNFTGGSPFRLIKKEIIKKVITHSQQFVFLDELLAWYTSSIEHVIVRHEASRLGESRYTAFGLASLYWNLVYGYNAAMLRTITILGIVSSLLSFLVGVFFIIKKLFFHVRIGFTGIVVSITFTGGIILLSVGIIGEYLRRMYNILNERPQYSIREIIE